MKNSKRYIFNQFELDCVHFTLKKDGLQQHIEPKVFEVLAYLIANKNQIVSKEQLIKSVWNGRIISDWAISRAIKEARKIIDLPSENSLIKTVYGRGYQFIGDVQLCTSKDNVRSKFLDINNWIPKIANNFFIKVIKLYPRTLLLLSIMLVALFYFDSSDKYQIKTTLHQNELKNFYKHSLIVLPFVNLSADSQQEYLADGITEEIGRASCRERVYAPV